MDKHDAALVERLAKALLRVSSGHHGDHTPWANYTESTKDEYRDMARVAIKIVRCPARTGLRPATPCGATMHDCDEAECTDLICLKPRGHRGRHSWDRRARG